MERSAKCQESKNAKCHTTYYTGSTSISLYALGMLQMAIRPPMVNYFLSVLPNASITFPPKEAHQIHFLLLLHVIVVEVIE
jgi:hypothetical protein